MRIAFDNAFVIRTSGASNIFVYLLEISWIIDILVNLVKVTPKMKQPTLRKTIWRYMVYGTFFFDFIPSIIGNGMIIYWDDPRSNTLADRMKLLRFIRVPTVAASVHYFVDKL